MVALVLSSGPVGKVILLVLLTVSIISWAIIFEKGIALARAEEGNRRFLAEFTKHAGEMDRLRKSAKNYAPAPAALLFAEAERRAELLRRGGLNGTESRGRVEQTVSSFLTETLMGQEKYLPFLATVANISPLIGLFGTVIGITNAFQEIGRQGTANIAAIAPGIAEALVTTVAGIFTAVPASIAYNLYLHRIRKMEVTLGGFGVAVAEEVVASLGKEE